MPQLTGKQFESLTTALLDSFPSLAAMRRLLRFKMGKSLDAIALGDDLTEIAFKVIGAAEAEGWTYQLILAARESNPGNALLFLAAQQIGLAPQTPARPELEALITRAAALVDVAGWRTRLGELEGRVCRIEVRAGDGVRYGTGFLVGPRAVLTNNHVVAGIMDGEVTPNQTVLRFDYKQLPNGTTVNPGTVCRLAADWLIDSSPHSPVDLELDPKSRVPNVAELDHALLLLDGEPGNAPLGKSDPEAPKRGWIDLAAPPAIAVGAPMLILQHPAAEPLKLGIDYVTKINENQTRIRYATPTLPGSSGSPCFDASFRLIALHHASQNTVQASYNEGIPIAAILELLRQRGKTGMIGAEQD